MKLSEARNPHIFNISRFDSTGLQVKDQWLNQSCLIAFDFLKKDWGVTHFDGIEQGLEAIADYAPEVLIIGTGSEQRFPNAQQMQALAQLKCGIEFMNNDSAIRTYTILTTEDRRVMLALIFEAV
jgi:uncharacterized protein